MKITSIKNDIKLQNKIESDKNSRSVKNNTNFKAGIGPEALMQWVESQGFLISFLVQDGLGMTLPRVFTGFNRDKEYTGKYNVQEGLEVFGREALTGPVIVGVAPVFLAFIGRYCKSTYTNTRLIKRIGANLRSMIEKPTFDKDLLTNKKEMKKAFYEFNIEKLLIDNNIIKSGEDNKTLINQLVEELEKTEKGKKDDVGKHFSNIVSIINDKQKAISNEFFDLNKIRVGEKNNKIQVGTIETFRAIRDYAIDSIVRNKDLSLLTSQGCENIKNNLATKRFLANVSNIVITLTSLAFLPKLYMRSKVAPGAKLLLEQQSKQQINEQDNNKGSDKDNTTFKAKGINNDGILSRLGKFFTKDCLEKAQALLEYAGVNFTKTTFALLSTLGLLLPRGKQAWDRAVIDKNGKRDMSEINEILLRDTTSSLSVVFAVPLLTKLLVKSYENKTGFILTNRASDGKNPLAKAWAIINPYSKLEVLSLADLDAIYGKIDTKEKMLNFAKFIDNKGGDLDKILHKSKAANEFFNDKVFKYSSNENLTKSAKNKEIIQFIEKITSNGANEKNKMIEKLMQGALDVKNNSIAKFARNMNSWPGFISTFILSPIILGVLIPMLTYHKTRQANAKKLEEMQMQQTN